MTLQINLTHDPAALDMLRDPWTELQAKSATDTVYLTWEWVKTWWDHFGHDKTLWLITAKTDDGRLVGIAPLVVEIEREFRFAQMRMLTFVGGRGPMDHLDFIIERGLESEVIPAFLAAIQEEHGWDVLSIAHIREDSPNLPILQASGITWEEDEARIAPYVVLNTTWDKYLQTLSTKTRQNQRRNIKKLDTAFPDRWVFDVVSDPADIRPTLARLIELHQAQWQAQGKPGSFADPQVAKFHHAVAHLLMEKGWLRLLRLRIDGQLVAAALTFAFRGRAYGFSMGVDYSIPHVELGHAMVQLGIRDAAESGMSEYDFLWGDEEWKYRWNAVNRIDRTLEWYGSARGKMGHGLVKIATGTWRQVHDLLPDSVAQRIRSTLKGKYAHHEAEPAEELEAQSH